MLTVSGVELFAKLEDHYSNLEAQPGHKLAVPLFFLTSIPYFITLGIDYWGCCQIDKTFAWLGGFYVVLGGVYMIAKFIKNGETLNIK